MNSYPHRVITLPVTGSAVPKNDPRFLMSYAEREELIEKTEQLEKENARLREANGRLIQMVRRAERDKERILWALVIGGFAAIMALCEMTARAGGMLG